MNWSEVKGDWQQMKPVLQAYWPALTEEDLAAVKGDRDELVRVLRRRYTFTAEQAHTAVCDFEKDVRWPGAVKGG